jgi:hypothetical protein
MEAAERVVVDLEVELVDEAPPPILARLVRADQRVLGGAEVLAGVAVRRRVAAADVSALEA